MSEKTQNDDRSSSAFPSSSSSSSCSSPHLAEGLIFPQKSILHALIFKSEKKTRSRNAEVLFPDAVRVLVGTRRALEEWARASGPASSTLWAEVPEECMELHSPDVAAAARKLWKSQLCFAYRLRSFTPFVRPVFPGLLLLVSPEKAETLGGACSASCLSSKKKKKKKDVGDEAHKGSDACGRWQSLRQKEKEKLLKSRSTGNHLDDDHIPGRKQGNGSSSGWKWIQRWCLALPWRFFEKLVDMISPGGVLWHFQQLLQKLVCNSLFIDTRFELLDVNRWIKRHSYAVVLEGSRLVICLSTSHWTIVKLDFSDNAVRITGGKCLQSLLETMEEEKEKEEEEEEEEEEDSLHSYGFCHESCENRTESAAAQVKRKWRVCHLSERSCNLHFASFLDAMYDNGGFSEQEAGSAFKQDFGFLGAFETEGISQLAPRIQELTYCSRDPNSRSHGFSSRERCALSNLGNSSWSARRRGIHALLEILMQDAKDMFVSSRSGSRSDLANRRGGDISLALLSAKPSLCSTHSMNRNASTSTSGDLSSTESCRAGTDSPRQHFKGSLMSQNAFQHAASVCQSLSRQSKDVKHELFVDAQFDREILEAPLSPGKGGGKESESIGITKFFESLCLNASKSASEDYTCKIKSIQIRLLEWVHRGFLESLIEEAIKSSGKCGLVQGDTVALSVDETAEVCLNVAQVLPADATSHIVDCLIGWLKDYTADNGLLKHVFDEGVKRQESRLDSSNRQLKSEVDKIWCLTKLLALLVNGSIFIASGMAKCGGLKSILELYASLVKIRISNQFQCPSNSNTCTALPGEVMEQEKTSLLVSPSTKHCSGVETEDKMRYIPSEGVFNISMHTQKHDLLKERGQKMLEGSFSRLADIMTKMASLCSGRSSSPFIFDQRKDQIQVSERGCVAENEHSKERTAVQKTQPPVTNGLNSDGRRRDPILRSSERPKVPKLILKPCLISKQGSRLQGTDHECHRMVLEANLCLLEVFHALLVHHSAAAASAQREVMRKIYVNHDTIISSFIMDMCNFFNSFCQPDDGRLQELIFQVIYQLDRLWTQMNNTQKHGQIQNVGLNHVTDSSKEAVLQGGDDISFRDHFLREASRNLRLAFSSNSSARKRNSHCGMMENCSPRLAFEIDDRAGSQMSSLSFWPRISMLMSIVADFSIFLSAKGFTCSLLLQDVCGYFDEALSVFSGLEPPSVWTLPQILAMQSLLSLLKASFQIIKDDKSYAGSSWTDFEENLWQVIVRNKKHWSCVNNYLSWLLLESCHGCYKNIFNYSRYYADMPEALVMLLFRNQDFCLESSGVRCLRDAFQCLDSLVTLFYRRMQVKVSSCNNNFSLSLSEDMTILDCLMNPVDGLLMNILKCPFFQGRTIHTERKIEREAWACAITCEDQISLLRGRHEHDVSPSLELSSARNSIRSCKLTGSIRVSTEDDRLLNPSPHCMYGRSSWQTLYLFKLRKLQLTCDLTCNPTFLDVESSYPSLHLNIDSSRCLCKSCTARVIVQGLASRISMFIEEECLNLLVKVFSLKFTEYAVKSETASGSPYLKQSYVDAFLDYHFLCFMQLYNWKGEGQLKKKPINQSNPSSTEAWDGDRSACVQNEESLSTQDSSSIADLCTTVFSEDETVSVACRKHGEVLLAISENKDEHVSKRFKQLKIMDFLVHQMALEYELSNVATPRESSSENLLNGVFQSQSKALNDFHSRNLLADNVFPRSEKILADNKSVSSAIQRVELDENVANNDGGSLNHHCRDISCTDLDNGKTAIYLGAPNFNLLRLKQRSAACKDNVQMPLDQPVYASCRSRTNKKYLFPVSSRSLIRQLGSEDHHRRRPFTHEKPSPLPAVFSYPLKAFSDRCETIRRKKLKENTLHPRSGKGYGSLDSLDGRFSPITHGEDMFGNAMPVGSSSKGSHCSGNTWTQKMVETNCKRRDNDLKGLQRNSKFVYCGRFCDLNEEVERELAQEDASGIDCQVDGKSASLQLKPDQDFRGKVSETSSIIPNNQLPQKTVSSIKRPQIPKLNLPKSARKGDEDSSLGESVEEDFLVENKRSVTPIQPDEEQFISSEFNPGAIYSGGINKTVALPYESECVKRRIYRDTRLHLLLLELFVSLMITPQGTLDTSYSDRFPMDGQRMNAPFYLLYHINHTANAVLSPFLRQRMKSFSPPVHRIFKLLWRDYFNSSLYTNRHRIAHGAFAQVYAATFTKMDGDKKICKSVVLKMVDLPKSPHDPCKFFDIYSEVEILEKFIGDDRVCQLLDYGVDVESFVLVLKHYKCSLRYWRQHHDIQFCREKDSSDNLTKAFYKKLPLYLEIYSAVLQAVKVLELHNVVHYDLKCDNILLEPLETTQSEEEFWNPVLSKMMESFTLPFRVCIADFGQSKASILQGGECTVRNRGTEYVKSPEMLMLLSNKQDDNLMNIPEKDESVGRAVDVWGLGCLLYELLTGEYLLYDEDWTRFFIRVTLPSEELITGDKAAKLNNFKPIIEFLNFVLVRDPHQRPTLDAVIQKLNQLQLVLLKDGIGYDSSANKFEEMLDLNVGKEHTELRCIQVPDGKNEIGRPAGADSSEKFSTELTTLVQHIDNVEQKDIGTSRNSKFCPRDVLLRSLSSWKTYITKLICGG